MIAGAVALLVLTAQAGKATAAAECPNEELRTEKSAGLPDCRAYEQVSPVEKQGDAGYYPFGPQLFNAKASATRDGSVMFTSHEPMPGSLSGTLENLYLTTRGTNGWTYKGIAPTVTPVPGGGTLPHYRAVSGDLTKSILVAQTPPLAAGTEPDVDNLYAENNETGTFTLLTPAQGGDNSSRQLINFVGASSDFSRVFLLSAVPLLPESPPEAANIDQIYEFADGQLHLAGIAPDGSVLAEAVPVGGEGLFRGFNAVSEDGSRVYFNSSSGEKLFVRVDGDRTTQVNESKRAVPDEAAQGATFWSATSDGNEAFFTSRNALTEDANTGKDSEGKTNYTGANLYRFNLTNEGLTDLSVDTNPLDAETGAEVLGVVGASDDGSYVYFVARGDLAEGAARGANNLYLWHGGAVKFLATLAGSDEGNWTSFMPSITSRVSSDGRHVLLSSAARLTSYDNTDAVSGAPDTEIYRYSAETSTFECMSCNADGSQPRESTTLTTLNVNATEALPNYMSENGEVVAFVSREALVPQDTNGLPDVYEYRDGSLNMISTGNTQFEAQFGDLSPDGTDLYFSTVERLLPTDIDNYADLYDARKGGGFAHPVPPTICVGNECGRTTSSPPSPSAMGSQDVSAAGNASAPKQCGAKKRLVKRHGKTQCVRKSPPAKKHGKQHGKKRRGAGANKGGSR
jgi:hypothetical protein